MHRSAFTYHITPQAFFNLPNNIALTAKLTLDYRAPTKADQVRLFKISCSEILGSDFSDQFVVIKCKLESTKGRKAVVSSRVEDMQGKVLIEASLVVTPSFLLPWLTLCIRAIFVEPKYANLLKATSSVGVLVGTKAEPPVSAPV
jgi:hypothetical protein